MEDPRELDRRALIVLDKLVSTVTPADLERRTPCEGWTLADLLRHQVSENRGFGAALLDGSAPDWDSGELGADPYGSYADSVDLVLATLDDDAVLDRQVTVREFGTFPGIVAVSMHLVDTVAHGWDIAGALGLPYAQDADIVHTALKIAEQIPADPEFRSERGSFKPVVPTESASELHRFLGLLGRSPDWA
ncbi:TIGR03086 family metal-binding protein [Amycolatopsis sp.]|uniref:TIGR03086 family metal-binding protein n=1 Tax=Amycolatopsis sp. TaxID=37632 RepID=UPI002C6A5BF3|nr:TIGR03086 family metal-binding protein [Amycolatopsis sp.]HVV10269.1 TIGR03086 family metal-binding protein [Amycolatopsis sp.]